MNVTVFGGSQPTPGEAAYEQAVLLGQRLAQAGHTVLTGGYIGTMEAVSRGAAEAGGFVVGVTCDEIEAWRPVGCNAYVTEERREATLRLRLFRLIEDSDAALALPGGVGTLAEIAMMWSHLLTEAIAPRPLILIGPEWRQVFDTFYAALGIYVSDRQRRWVSFAQDIDEAVELLNRNLWTEKNNL
jgi:uncharacterized protein (TIGR00725 family)